jgi:hypothetical protein
MKFKQKDFNEADELAALLIQTDNLNAKYVTEITNLKVMPNRSEIESVGVPTQIPKS